MIVLKNPALQLARETLEESLKKSLISILVGSCTIDYSGRAKSHLELGERLVILKPDGTLLIHRSRGAQPINWQPPNSIFSLEFEEEKLILKSVRRKSPELMKLHFEAISLLVSMRLDDDATFNLRATEIDMHAAVMKNPALFEDGFKPVTHELKTNVGYADIFGFDRMGRPVVIEIKKNPVSKEDVDQLRCYIQDLKPKYENQNLRGVILGPTITKTGKANLMQRDIPLEFKKLTVEKCLKAKKTPPDRRLSDFV